MDDKGGNKLSIHLMCIRVVVVIWEPARHRVSDADLHLLSASVTRTCCIAKLLDSRSFEVIAPHHQALAYLRTVGR